MQVAPVVADDEEGPEHRALGEPVDGPHEPARRAEGGPVRAASHVCHATDTTPRHPERDFDRHSRVIEGESARGEPQNDCHVTDEVPHALHSVALPAVVRDRRADVGQGERGRRREIGTLALLQARRAGGDRSE